MIFLIHLLRQIELQSTRMLRSLGSDSELSTETTEDSEEETQSKFATWFFSACKKDTALIKAWKKCFQHEEGINNTHSEKIIKAVPGNLNYRKIFIQQLNLEKKWCQTPGNKSDLSSDHLSFKTFLCSGEIKGFAFLKESEDPDTLTFEKTDSSPEQNDFKTIIQGDGGFLTKYSHTVPALFLQTAFANANNLDIDFHLLCHGFKYNSEMFEWGWSYSSGYATNPDGVSTDNWVDFAGHLLTSDDLKEIRKTELTKNIRRICIWMQLHKHVITLCWDEFRNYDTFKHYFTIYCNMGNDVTDVKGIMTGIKEVLRNKEIIQNNENIEYADEVVDRGFFRTDIDFACVSVMARCGLYLSWFESAHLNPSLTSIINNQKETEEDFKSMRKKYELFEIDLFNFIETQSETNHLILLPPSLNAHFVNTSKILLVTMNMKSDCTEYKYFGEKHKFQRINSNQIPRKCVIS